MTAHHRWGVLTDLHLAPAGAPPTRWHNEIPRGETREVLDQALAAVGEHAVDRLVLLGDLADAATADDYGFLSERLERTGLPAWVIPGNHDRPHNQSHALDGSIELPAVTGIGGIVVMTGELWLESEVQEAYTFDLSVPGSSGGELLVVLTHFPLLDLSDQLAAANLENAGELRNRSAVAASLTEWAGPVLVLHGHQHVRCHALQSNVLQLGFGALAETPHDTAVLDLTVAHGADGIGVRVERTCRALAHLDADWRPSLLDPERTTHRWQGGTWLSA